MEFHSANPVSDAASRGNSGGNVRDNDRGNEQGNEQDNVRGNDQGNDDTHDLLNQLVSVANQANIAVVVALTDDALYDHQPYGKYPHSKAPHNRPSRHGDKAHKTDHSAKPDCTINIRDAHRQHDTTLLIRQVFALLEIALPENSIYSAYPVKPSKSARTVPLQQQHLTDDLSRHTPDWHIHTPAANASATELHRELRFSSFQAAIRYVNQVAPACDIANHHPRWENNWRTLRIWLTTWDAEQQITRRDIELARYFDHVYADYR